MKMYILVKEELTAAQAIVAAAHASLGCYLTFVRDEDMQEWVANHFTKVVLSVNAAQFERAKDSGVGQTFSESALGGMETAIALCPRHTYPWRVKELPLWTGVPNPHT